MTFSITSPLSRLLGGVPLGCGAALLTSWPLAKAKLRGRGGCKGRRQAGGAGRTGAVREGWVGMCWQVCLLCASYTFVYHIPTARTQNWRYALCAGVAPTLAPLHLSSPTLPSLQMTHAVQHPFTIPPRMQPHNKRRSKPPPAVQLPHSLSVQEGSLGEGEAVAVIKVQVALSPA